MRFLDRRAGREAGVGIAILARIAVEVGCFLRIW
jgi:hypothetical protein